MKILSRILFALVVLCFAGTSCSENIEENEFLKEHYSEASAFRKVIENNGVKMEMNYLHPKIFQFGMNRGDCPKSSIKEGESQLHLFKLRIYSNEGMSLEKLSSYFMGNVGMDFYSEGNGIKTPCSLIQYYPNGGLAPFQEILLGFPKGNTNEFSLVWDDPILLNQQWNWNFSLPSSKSTRN